MSETVVVRTDGGSLMEMDIPPLGTFARERFDEQIEKRQLAIITTPVKWVERGQEQYGIERVLVDDVPEDAPAPPAPVAGSEHEALLADVAALGLIVDPAASDDDLRAALDAATQPAKAPKV